MNSTPTYLNLENMVCLNLDITENNVTAMSLQTTVSALIKGENMCISRDDLGLSSDEEDGPMTPPKSFLQCSTETDSTEYSSSYFSPNSDDELAKYLNSETVSNTNIKKEKIEDPECSPPKITKKEKKGSNNRKRK